MMISPGQTKVIRCVLAPVLTFLMVDAARNLHYGVEVFIANMVLITIFVVYDYWDYVEARLLAGGTWWQSRGLISAAVIVVICVLISGYLAQHFSVLGPLLRLRGDS